MDVSELLGTSAASHRKYESLRSQRCIWNSSDHGEIPCIEKGGRGGHHRPDTIRTQRSLSWIRPASGHPGLFGIYGILWIDFFHSKKRCHGRPGRNSYPGVRGGGNLLDGPLARWKSGKHEEKMIQKGTPSNSKQHIYNIYICVYLWRKRENETITVGPFRLQLPQRSLSLDSDVSVV